MTPLLAAEGPSEASSSSNVSSSPTLLSHSTAAPAVRTPPSSAKTGVACPSRHAQVGRSPEWAPNTGRFTCQPQGERTLAEGDFYVAGPSTVVPEKSSLLIDDARADQGLAGNLAEHSRRRQDGWKQLDRHAKRFAQVLIPLQGREIEEARARGGRDVCAERSPQIPSSRNASLVRRGGGGGSSSQRSLLAEEIGV